MPPPPISFQSLNVFNVFHIPAVPHVTGASELLSTSFFALSFPNLLSSPPPFHRRCKSFLHMPAIPSCIPVNRTPVTAAVSARPAASLSSLLLSLQQSFRERVNECPPVPAALFLLDSRWRHSPTFFSSPVWDVSLQNLTACRAKSSSNNR